MNTHRGRNASNPDHVGRMNLSKADFQLIFSDVFSTQIYFSIVGHIEVMKSNKCVRIAL